MITVDCNFDLIQGGTMSQRTLTTLYPTANLIGGLSHTAAAVEFALGHGYGLLLQVCGLGIQFAGDLGFGGIDLSVGSPGLRQDDSMPKKRRGEKCSEEFSVLIH
jgi:hypothetical protein